MNFVDDAGIGVSWPYAARLALRNASAIWFWGGLLALLLSLRYPASETLFQRFALTLAFIGAGVFAAIMGWFLLYAWAKRRVHTPR